MNHNRATMAVFGRCFLALVSVCVLQSSLRAVPMVYTGTVVTDVRVGRTFLHNASLKIMFEGDTDDIMVVPMVTTECGNNVLGYFLYLTRGIARMEIEYQGRTRTATLREGQLFVALDECNGGIGFGSFVNPNGPEVAYPLAFTMGTAEYAAITYGSPLTGALSTTGAAWSCIGYPPNGSGALPETANDNCIPPDGYPIKSDIGDDIFVYQPYFEYSAIGSPGLPSSHSGSTNRGAFLVRPQANRMLAASGAQESEIESGVVYTLQTVADGSIGNHGFNQALVTLRMISNTKSVTTQPSPVDATKSLYENYVGSATITVDDGGTVINAKIEPGEVYVRYDTGAGVAGFGSQISPTYPIALDCSDSAYPSDSSYTADCLQGDAWNNLKNQGAVFHGGTLAQLNYPVAPSAGVAALPQSLSQNTLLTGTAHTCAGIYTISPFNPFNFYFPGDLGKCGGPAPRGLRTNKGDLFLQDREGGTLSLGGLGPQGGANFGGGWTLANSGFLHVEVLRGDN